VKLIFKINEIETEFLRVQSFHTAWVISGPPPEWSRDLLSSQNGHHQTLRTSREKAAL